MIALKGSLFGRIGMCSSRLGITGLGRTLKFPLGSLYEPPALPDRE